MYIYVQIQLSCWSNYQPIVPGDKQHQISRGDNYNKFYLLLLFDHRGFGVYGLGFGFVIGGFYVHTLV